MFEKRKNWQIGEWMWGSWGWAEVLRNWELVIGNQELGLWTMNLCAAAVPAFRCTCATLRCRCNSAARGQQIVIHPFLMKKDYDSRFLELSELFNILRIVRN